jgi:hypothetical protein
MESHASYRIDMAPTPWPGQLAMAACPGMRSSPRAGEDALSADVARIAALGCRVVITLLDGAELQRLGASDLGTLLVSHGIVWHQLPVADFGVPGATVTARWRSLLPALREVLDSGPMLIHCAHGKGRTGTLAATLFTEWGWTADAAIAHVRWHRPGAIETPGQEAYVRSFAAARASGG